MTKKLSGDALQLRSIIKRDGTLELSLVTVPIPEPKDDEVLVHVEASPINPSENQALPLPDGTTPAQGASWFVNPLTSLGMVETMRLEGHSALVHTAAASNLGQMLQKVCLADEVPLVNIVRKAEQVALLRGMGASHVCNSSEPTFMKDLTDALIATGATLTLDAISLYGKQATGEKYPINPNKGLT